MLHPPYFKRLFNEHRRAAAMACTMHHHAWWVVDVDGGAWCVVHGHVGLGRWGLGDTRSPSRRPHRALQEAAGCRHSSPFWNQQSQGAEV
jgi:hypothetical protein